MKKITLLLILFSLMTFPTHAKNNSYTQVVDGFDWGPGASKVILPMEYMHSSTAGRNRSQWLDYQLIVKAPELGLEWNTESRRIRPLVDQFQLDGVYVLVPQCPGAWMLSINNYIVIKVSSKIIRHEKTNAIYRNRSDDDLFRNICSINTSFRLSV